MKAVIRSLHSPDVEDLETFEPEEPDLFGALIQMMVGPADGPGEESFDVVVCTPRWLANEIEKAAPSSGGIISSSTSTTFRESAPSRARRSNPGKPRPGRSWLSAIGRIGMWEFENYRE